MHVNPQTKRLKRQQKRSKRGCSSRFALKNVTNKPQKGQKPLQDEQRRMAQGLSDALLSLLGLLDLLSLLGLAEVYSAWQTIVHQPNFKADNDSLQAGAPYQAQSFKRFLAAFGGFGWF